MVPSKGSFELVKGNKVLIPQFLKNYLGGWVCYINNLGRLHVTLKGTKKEMKEHLSHPRVRMPKYSGPRPSRVTKNRGIQT